MWFKLPEKSFSHSKPFELGFPFGKPQFRFTCKPELNYNVANLKHSGCFDPGSSLDSNEKFELSKTDLLKSIRLPSSSFLSRCLQSGNFHIVKGIFGIIQKWNETLGCD